jgi:hypothetical protein
MTPTKDDIRKKLVKRDRLEADLRKADQELMAAGRAFWDAQGCRAFPRIDALRRAVA